jgi:hypothetical protein
MPFNIGDRVVITLDTYGRYNDQPGTVVECPAGCEFGDGPGIVWLMPDDGDDRTPAPGFPENIIRPLAGYFRDANGEPIEEGRAYWNSDLDLVRLVKIADWPADRKGDPNTEPYCAPWHTTERLSDGRKGNFDSGRHGRLSTFHPMTRQDAREAAKAVTR